MRSQSELDPVYIDAAYYVAPALTIIGHSFETEEQLIPFGEQFRQAWLQTYGKQLEAEDMIEVYEFFTYMAEEEGLTLQTASQPIRHFEEKPTEVKDSAVLTLFIMKFYDFITEKNGKVSYEEKFQDPVIGGFVRYMAEMRGYIFQRALEPVKDFRPHLL